ncbi:hypothetical protein THASP1DRAFT_33086 [Thamnocephalis sphaerospora]|uniref:Uncharacterized protein n=1 Tax=Thamnocephalis sphaerospora TaxID=78915 RepID=A0A4P9XHJ6_9FUNG|nr:hypothetical protein THASP1DRAFT_33086 [Thamnocephalis sphaerospora]|eukprot:RKP05086.1 hypothetical protein THASP1DRAFT_33086 [Thamnocephalis sphaerospora]
MTSKEVHRRKPAPLSTNALEKERLARRHPWPMFGWLLLALTTAGWIYLLEPDVKLRAIFHAACFSVIEFTFYSVTVEMPNGDIILRPFSKDCRAGHTTIQQFFANVFYTPILVDVYFALMPDYWLLRVLLFPINIWLLEVVEGYVLTFLYGYNPAWVYYGHDVFFSNNIKLSYWPYWLMLGGVLELAFPMERTVTFALIDLL